MTERHKKLIEMAGQGICAREIMKVLGYSLISLHGTAKRLNVTVSCHLIQKADGKAPIYIRKDAKNSPVISLGARAIRAAGFNKDSRLTFHAEPGLITITQEKP